ncbi:MAG: STAS domain-containing protein [Solirubrobacterales bacterium]
MSPLPFEVQSEVEQEVRVITVSGELDLDTAPRLAEALEVDASALLIDLSECEFIDSTGIALIVRAAQRLNNDESTAHGGGFALCCVNDQVRRLFDVTGLGDSIPLHDSRQDAIAGLRS